MLKFDFTVGESEIHKVDFYFNQFWGKLFIELDGTKILKTVRFYSFNLTKEYEFDVGISEKHAVKIEITRKQFLAGFREYNAKVYIDNVFHYKFKGKFSKNDFVLNVCNNH